MSDRTNDPCNTQPLNTPTVVKHPSWCAPWRCQVAETGNGDHMSAEAWVGQYGETDEERGLALHLRSYHADGGNPLFCTQLELWTMDYEPGCRKCKRLSSTVKKRVHVTSTAKIRALIETLERYERMVAEATVTSW